MLSHLQALRIFLLLFVYDAEPKVDLIGFLKVRLHMHYLGERFFGMLQGTISIIKDANTVPQLRLLVFVRWLKNILGNRNTLGSRR